MCSWGKLWVYAWCLPCAALPATHTPCPHYAQVESVLGVGGKLVGLHGSLTGDYKSSAGKQGCSMIVTNFVVLLLPCVHAKHAA